MSTPSPTSRRRSIIRSYPQIMKFLRHMLGVDPSELLRAGEGEQPRIKPYLSRCVLTGVQFNVKYDWDPLHYLFFIYKDENSSNLITGSMTFQLNNQTMLCLPLPIQEPNMYIVYCDTSHLTPDSMTGIMVDVTRQGQRGLNIPFGCLRPHRVDHMAVYPRPEYVLSYSYAGM